MQAILASQNAHKAQEFASSLVDIQISPAPVAIDVDENADSFIGNAQLKARAYAHQLNTNALADDSGLCVDCLNGLPGIYSARFATLPPDIDNDPDRTAANNRKLLRLMKDVPDSKRGAHFCCALCLVIVNPEDIHRFLKHQNSNDLHCFDSAQNELSPCEDNRHLIKSIEISVLGKSFGRIIHTLTGSGGFGYDPLFYSIDANCTFAQLSREQKLSVSHRGRAIGLLNDVLTTVCISGASFSK